MNQETIEVADLWIERASDVTGFDRVSTSLTGSRSYGPYFLVLTIVAIHIPLLSSLGYLQTGVLSMARNPGELFQIPAWLAVVWMLRRTKAKYEATLAELPDSIDEDIHEVSLEGTLKARVLTALGVPENPDGKYTAGLEEMVPDRLILGIFLVGLSFHAIQLVFDPANLIGPVAALTGYPVAAIRFFIIIPLFLYPIGAEFLGIVIGTLILFPFKIRRSNLLDFSDPHGFGGLSPAGELFKSIAVSYLILLTLFTTFQTIALGASPTDLFTSTFILAGLGLALVLFFAPLYWIQTFVATAKEAKVEAIANRTRKLGQTEEIFPYAEPDSRDDASQYTYNHIRMQRVEATSDFPINFGMIREILFALILPYVTSMLFDMLLHNAL